MIRVHHLDHSRSFRILWLLEELELPYELVQHHRDRETRLAPPSLQLLHPLGKAPLIEDDGRVLHESGAIIDYLIRRHGGGRLAPSGIEPGYDDYQMWLHYAEGSAMLPVMIDLYARTRGAETPALRARVDDELGRHAGYVEASLAGRDYLVGGELTGADIQMGFAGELLARVAPGDHPNIARWLESLQARPAYARALAKGGEPLFQRPAAVEPRR